MQNVQGKDRNLVQMQVAQRRLAVTYPCSEIFSWFRFLLGYNMCVLILLSTVHFLPFIFHVELMISSNELQ
jgi:hypothetical protein